MKEERKRSPLDGVSVTLSGAEFVSLMDDSDKQRELANSNRDEYQAADLETANAEARLKHTENERAELHQHIAQLAITLEAAQAALADVIQDNTRNYERAETYKRRALALAKLLRQMRKKMRWMVNVGDLA